MVAISELIPPWRNPSRLQVVNSPLPPLPQIPDIDRHPLTIMQEGQVYEWFQALYQKKTLVDANDPRADEIDLELDLAGGGMQGVLHVGLLIALKKEGLHKYVNRVVGVSTGSLAAFVAWGVKEGMEAEAERAYFKVAQHGIVNGRRMATRDIVDLERLYTLLSPYVDNEKIEALDTNLSFIVTDVETGKAVEVKAKNLKDPLIGAVASAAIPGGTKSPFKLTLKDGSVLHVIDGMVSYPYPVSENRKENTHRLVVVPYPADGEMSPTERSYMASDPRLLKYPKARGAIWNVNRALQGGLADIRADYSGRHPTTGLVHTKEVIDPLSQDWLNVLRPYQLRAENEYTRIINDVIRQQAESVA